MALSKILEPEKEKDYPIREKGCMLNITDCQYIGSDGNCAAEWCLWKSLPPIAESEVSRELECLICKNKIQVSIYSKQSVYICDECWTKINELLNKKPEPKTCCICGAITNNNRDLCSNCINKLKEKLNESTD